MDWSVGVWGGGFYFHVYIIVRIITSHHQHVSVCSCLTSSFSKEWNRAGRFGGNLGAMQRDCVRHVLLGIRESECLNARFKPRSGFAGITVCWAPIVIRLGCLLFCFVWILFLDLTNVFSNQTKSSLGQGGETVVQRLCYSYPPLLIPSPSLVVIPPTPMQSKDGGCLGVFSKLLFSVGSCMR